MNFDIHRNVLSLEDELKRLHRNSDIELQELRKKYDYHVSESTRVFDMLVKQEKFCQDLNDLIINYFRK